MSHSGSHLNLCSLDQKRCKLCNNLSNYKASKQLTNEKWIHISVQTCGISEQAFGSCCADRLYRLFLKWHVQLHCRLNPTDMNNFLTLVIQDKGWEPRYPTAKPDLNPKKTRSAILNAWPNKVTSRIKFWTFVSLWLCLASTWVHLC